MISVHSVSPTRLYSAVAEKLAPHRLTLLFGLAVLGAIAVYVYRRLNPSLHDLCKQAFEKEDYQKVTEYCAEEFSRLDRTNVPFDSSLNIAPYFWRNAVDLKKGEFDRVIDSCRKVSKCKMNDQLKAQFVLQEMEARLGLNQLAETTQTFEKNKDLLTKQSKLLGHAHYLRALAYKGALAHSDAVVCCDEALKQIPAQDLELNVKVLVLKSLALLDLEQYQKSAEIGHSVLIRLHRNSKISKETWVIFYFSYGLSEYALKKCFADFDFKVALTYIDENDQYLHDLLTFQRCYLSAAFEESYTRAQIALREAEEAYNTCNGKSDDRRPRSELMRYIIRIIVSNLSIGSTLFSKLATRNRSLPRAT